MTIDSNYIFSHVIMSLFLYDPSSHEVLVILWSFLLFHSILRQSRYLQIEIAGAGQAKYRQETATGAFFSHK